MYNALDVVNVTLAKIAIKKKTKLNEFRLFVYPAWVQSNGLKFRVYPSSRKDIVNDKGIHREVESEGIRKANLWSDEQKSHKELGRDKAAKQVKVQ